MKKISIAAPGYPFILTALALTVLSYFIYPILLPLLLMILIFTIYFFRDPERRTPGQENKLFSPADGRVIRVEEVYEPYFIKGKARKVSIFLSIFNVHVNRCPFAGRLVFASYVPGRFLAAHRKEAAQQNERNMLGLETDRGKVLVVQVAGLIARRIVCWIKPGDQLSAGARIGMIRFGSCTEVFFPLEARLKVKEGDKVRGGETVLGEF